MNPFSAIVLLYLPTAVLFVAWLFLRMKDRARRKLAVCWTAVTLVAAVAGLTLHSPADGCTALAFAGFATVPVLATGAVLLLTVTRRRGLIPAVIGCVVLPVPAYAVTFILMGIMGQVSGGY